MTAGPSSLEPNPTIQTILNNQGILEPDHEYSSSRGTSFRSLTSYNSFRSCKTYKSMGGVSSMSRSSYKSCVSKHTGREVGSDNPGFYDCKDEDTASYFSAFDVCGPALQQLPEHHARASSFDGKKDSLPTAHMYLGYVFAILAGITFSVSNVLIEFLPNMDSWTLLLFRSAAQLLVTVPIVVMTRSNPFGAPPNRTRLFMQGVVGAVLLLSIFLAVQRLPVGDAAAIFFSAPFLSMVLSCLILKEHCGIFRTLVSFSLLAGVIILSRPSTLFYQATVEGSNGTSTQHHTTSVHQIQFPANLVQFNVLGWPLNFNQSESIPVDPDNSSWTRDPIGIIAALSVPVLSAYLVILTRQCRTVHFSVLLMWLGVGGLLVGVVGLLTLGDPHQAHGTQEWTFAILIAGLGLTGNILMTKALCWVQPGKVMVLRTFEIVAAYILQIVVFNLRPNWIDLGGTLLVMLAVFLMGIEDIITKKIKNKYF